MSGKKGRSGRHKSLGTIMNEALEKIDQSFPELIDKLIEKALEGNQEAIQYALDRRIGKPSIKAVISPGEPVASAEEVMRMRVQIDTERDRFESLSPEEQLAEIYTDRYGDKESWPTWAIKAVESKQLTEGITSPEIDENTPQEED